MNYLAMIKQPYSTKPQQVHRFINDAISWLSVLLNPVLAKALCTSFKPVYSQKSACKTARVSAAALE